MFFMLEGIYTTGTPYETEKLSLRDNTIIFPSTYKQIVVRMDQSKTNVQFLFQCKKDQTYL